jgi:threonine dehydratase
MDIRTEVKQAEERIRKYVRNTFLDRSPYLSETGEANVFCKLENLQHTGSFKVRGAMNKLLFLSPADRSHGVVAASTGNHGTAVAFSARKLGVEAVVFVPEHTDPSKVEAIERWGGTVRGFGMDAVDAERHARKYAAENGLVYVSPYNDPQVIGGQGTIAVELERRLERIDAVLASLGGGGLIAGIAGYLKSERPDVRVIGCSPENSQVMIQSVKAGRILDLPSLPTLSEGTAGGVEEGAVTFELCRDLVDEYVTVTEEEIGENLIDYMRHHRMLIEGAAAVTVAAYRKLQDRLIGQNVVLIICGANISPETLREVLGRTGSR